VYSLILDADITREHSVIHTIQEGSDSQEELKENETMGSQGVLTSLSCTGISNFTASQSALSQNSQVRSFQVFSIKVNQIIALKLGTLLNGHNHSLLKKNVLDIKIKISFSPVAILEDTALKIGTLLYHHNYIIRSEDSSGKHYFTPTNEMKGYYGVSRWTVCLLVYLQFLLQFLYRGRIVLKTASSFSCSYI